MKTRNLELDRLRAFAVIMTVVIHYARIFFPWDIAREYQHGSSIINILKNSWTGVDLFFVISGFIISKTIVQQIDNCKNSELRLAHYIKNFYIRRIYRIYPVAWLVFFMVLLSTFLFNKSGSFGTSVNTIEAGIAIFSYTFNYYFGFGSYQGFALSPYWSLSVEEQFYLLFPLFLILTKTTKQRIYLLLGMLALITFYIRPYAATENLFFTQMRCDGLMYGCLIYFLSQQPWFSNLITKNSVNKYFLIGITASLILVLSSITAIGFSNNIVIPVACVISSLLVTLAAFEKNIIISFSFIQFTLDYIGSRSYSLYICHLPIFSLTQEIMYRLSKAYGFSINHSLSAYYTGMALLLTIACTEILYRYIEIPFIKKAKNILNYSSEISVNKSMLTPTTTI